MMGGAGEHALVHVHQDPGAVQLPALLGLVLLSAAHALTTLPRQSLGAPDFQAGVPLEDRGMKERG
jgi:hypothetical protein